MDRINDTLFAHWNTDSHGNPQSVELNETQKVSPVHLCIQLNQIPDEIQRFEVRKDGVLLSEVYDSEPIGANNYKVDYGDGIVWFHSSRAGQTMQINYSGRGYKTISAKRVMINDGAYVEENTLQHLVDLNKEAVESINNIQTNLDRIMEEVRASANEAISRVEMSAENAENDIAREYGRLYAQMDSYVGEIIKYKSQALSEMKTILTTYKNESTTASSEMQKAIQSFERDALAKTNDLQNKYNQVVDEVANALERVKTFIESVQQGLSLYATEQRKEMLRSKEEVDVYKASIKNQMTDRLNELDEYVSERKESVDHILQHAQEISDDLEYIFKMQQLVWEGEFTDSQLDRLDKFMESQTTKQNEFDLSQEQRDREFDVAQTQQQDEFDENEAYREQIFEEMKNIVYDENAVLNNRKLINTKIDEVEFEEQVLELVRDPETGRITGSIGGDRIHFYKNVVNEDGTTAKEKVAEHLIVGRQSTYAGTEEPIDVEKIWYDLSDEDVRDLKLPENYALSQFQDTVNEIRKEVSRIETSVRMEDVKPGTFFTEDSNSSDVDEGSSNVKHVRIKVGTNPKLMQLAEGEMAYCTDTERLYIGVRQNPVSTITINKVIGGNSNTDSGNQGGNLTGEHLELDGKDGKKYRLYIDEDGVLKQRLVEYLDVEKPDASTQGVGARYKGLIINKYFGGGAKGNGKSPLSHGFIELYNNNQNGQTISLEGLCLYYKTIDDGVWRRFELKGYIPHQHSFLIRGARVNSKMNSSCRHEIDKFDQHWEMEFSNRSAMIYLGVDYGQLTITNPYNLSDGTTLNSYIDLLAGAHVDEERTLVAVEYNKSKSPAYRRLMTEDCGIHRIDFADTDSTYKDVGQINYRTCDISLYRPRCVEDGAWDLYLDKTKLNENIPNLLNIQYGKEWHTRTFTWQSKIMERGFLRYRKVGATKWIYKDTNTEIVYHTDQDCTIHRVIGRNLEEGLYEYQAGDEGCWGDVATFEVKSYKKDGTYDKTQHIKFLQVSDQQSKLESDYQAWRWAAKYIEDHENPEDYDFVVNCGDISDSGNRSFEWRCYYKFPRFLKEKCHMLCCGNNDLFEKIYSNCFKYYDSTENDFKGDLYIPNYGNHDVIQGKSPYGGYATSHSFDLGYVHFVVVNSNCTASVEDPDIWVKQMNWVRQDVQAARMRVNPPRWFIMVAHHGAFTVCRMKPVQQMIPFVEDLGFHVVLCGHHHTYSRSTPIRMNIREQVEAITGHDLYEVYNGCGQAIANAVYSIGYLETFANDAGVHVLPKGVTYDQTTENGTLEDGQQGVATNGNVGSREAYVNEETGVMWVMSQASGAKLKSNKDLEKTPTPWYYGWCDYDESKGYSNKPHPYKPNYLMWDISWDSISVKSYVVNGIVDYDNYLKTAVMKRPDEVSYEEMTRETIDSFTIPWRDMSSVIAQELNIKEEE